MLLNSLQRLENGGAIYLVIKDIIYRETIAFISSRRCRYCGYKVIHTVNIDTASDVLADVTKTFVGTEVSVSHSHEITNILFMVTRTNRRNEVP